MVVAEEDSKREEQQSLLDPTHKKHKRKLNFLPFVLMGALAVHAIFEGIATGLEKRFSTCINLCISIWLHKFAASMSISVAMQKNQFPFKTLFGLISIFSLATPLGVTIGIIVSNSPGMVEIVFTSLAAGTFLYIGASEVITEEFSLPGNRWLKLFAYCLGAAFILMLLLFD